MGLPALLAITCAAAPSSGQPAGRPLAPGDPAPAFSLAGSDGRTYRLADLKGRALVIAWFAKAFTGG